MSSVCYLLVPSVVACFLVDVFPALVRETVQIVLLTRQRRGLCRHYSG